MGFVRGKGTKFYGSVGLNGLDKLELSCQNFSGENLSMKRKCSYLFVANKKNKEQQKR